ncbi:MAG: D-aminoacylase, partial [Clostridia bacterium]|nr:D-aminoacylase [Clostridia bacterium]
MVDVLIKGGTVVDGTGGTRFRADVAVDGGRIVSVRENGTVPAREILDAEGLVVSPGFIDAHSHSDVSFLVDSSGASKL